MALVPPSDVMGNVPERRLPCVSIVGGDPRFADCICAALRGSGADLANPLDALTWNEAGKKAGRSSREAAVGSGGARPRPVGQAGGRAGPEEFCTGAEPHHGHLESSASASCAHRCCL